MRPANPMNHDWTRPIEHTVIELRFDNLEAKPVIFQLSGYSEDEAQQIADGLLSGAFTACVYRTAEHKTRLLTHE